MTGFIGCFCDLTEWLL